MKYFTNGTLNDPSLTGVTVAAFQTDADGNLQKGTYTGYLSQEITEAEYLVWVGRITNPDNVDYFHGAFGAMGVVDARTHALIEAKIASAKSAADLAKNRIVSSRQFNQGLILKGLDEQADAVVYGLPDATPQEIVYKKIVANWYFKSNQFESKNPILVQFAPMLGFDTTEKLNAFFDYCATL